MALGSSLAAAALTLVWGIAKCVQRTAVRYGPSTVRMSGSRLALVAPEADEGRARTIAEEINAEVDGRYAVRFASACWTAGESGEDVIARARAGLVRARPEGERLF